MIPAVVELRQYTLHPGRRDALITLFEREFVESQEAVGIRLIGLFRDLDDPDRFVWLRGFADMQARRQALEAFYTGPVWATHRAAANATMIDSDDVLLLRPAFDDPPDTRGQATGTVLVGVHTLDAVQPEPMSAALAALGLEPIAVMVTEPAENTFPRLPVRQDGPFLVWLAGAGDHAKAAKAHSAVTEGQLGPVSQLLRLSPTVRSRLRG